MPSRRTGNPQAFHAALETARPRRSPTQWMKRSLAGERARRMRIGRVEYARTQRRGKCSRNTKVAMLHMNQRLAARQGNVRNAEQTAPGGGRMADIEAQNRMRAGFYDHGAAQRKASCQHGNAECKGDRQEVASLFQNSHCPFLRVLTLTCALSPCSVTGSVTGTHEALPTRM